MRTAVLTLCALMPAGGQEIFVRRRNLCQRSRGRSYTQTNRHQISSRPSIIEINYNESPIKWPCADTTTSCIRPRCASSWPNMYRRANAHKNTNLASFAANMAPFPSVKWNVISSDPMIGPFTATSEGYRYILVPFYTHLLHTQHATRNLHRKTKTTSSVI